MDLEEHRDDRGWVVNPFDHLDSTGEVSHCHAFSVEPGCTRGGHAHPGRNEEILVLAGRLEVRTDEGAHLLDTSRLRILELGPGEAHTLTNRWESTAVAICWSSREKTGYGGPDTVDAGNADKTGLDDR